MIIISSHGFNSSDHDHPIELDKDEFRVLQIQEVIFQTAFRPLSRPKLRGGTNNQGLKEISITFNSNNQG